MPAGTSKADGDALEYFNLFARTPGGTVLTYADGKFGRTGRAERFGSVAAAIARGEFMWDRYPILRGFKLWVS
jgi:hypothetical protein